jgi:hypothetical protein
VLRHLFVAVAVLSASSVVAIASGLVLKATLAAPVQGTKEFIAGNTVWVCTGTSCVTHSNPEDARGVNGCRELRSQAGAIVEYGADRQPFGADKLSLCNSQ